MTVLIDETSLLRNVQALGKGMLSSTDIISRLRHHISSVSLIAAPAVEHTMYGGS